MYSRGGRRRGRGAAARKWVRPTSSSSTKLPTNSSSAETSTNNNKTIRKNPYVWKRSDESSEKLVTGSKVALSTAVNDDSAEEEVHKHPATVTSTETKSNNETKTSSHTQPPLELQRVGTNKLVAKDNHHSHPPSVSTVVPPEVAPTNLSTDRSSKSNDHNNNKNVMVHKGRHKLVLSSSSSATVKMNVSHQNQDKHTDDPQEGTNVSSSSNLLSSSQRTRSSRGRASRRGRGAAASVYEPPVKRIRLDSQTTTSSSSVGAAAVSVATTVNPFPQPPSGSNDNAYSTAANKPRLTEFAYRVKQSTVARRGGRRPPSQGNASLVRIATDHEPICPTFLRGVVCENAACTKRHDIPPQQAMPVCRHFEKQGQCHKGDACPFRHVKVHPKAAECPTFVTLGYCTNPDCQLKHVKGRGGIRTMTTRRGRTARSTTYHRPKQISGARDDAETRKQT